MFRYISTLVLLFCWALPGWGAGLDVYKWVDDDGSIHYDERERVPYAEKITVKRYRTPPGAAGTEAEDQQQEQPGTTSSICKQTRALLQSYRKAPFLYEEVDGKRKILSEQERRRIEARAEEDVEAACGTQP